MKLQLSILLCLLVVPLAVNAGARNHKENPIGRPVGTVRAEAYWLPKKRNQEVDLSNLFVIRWNGTREGEKVFLGKAFVKSLLVDEKKSTKEKLVRPPWVPANGATLYAAYVYELKDPLPAGAIFNNNTDHSVDPRAWSWMRLRKPLRFVTVCYTSRGMVATPDMPQKGMRPAPLPK